MRLALERTSLWKPLLSIVAIVALTGTTAAEDLDQGKSGAKLFADTCAACRRPSCQWALPPHALHVLERPLRDEFGIGLGVGCLSGVHRKRATWPTAKGGSETVTHLGRRIRVSAAAA
jgi:hypothetical protein